MNFMFEKKLKDYDMTTEVRAEFKHTNMTAPVVLLLIFSREWLHRLLMFINVSDSDPH